MSAAGLAGMGWLLRREIVRLLRQPTRIVGTFGAPALLWVFFAAGFGGMFAGREGPEGDSYAFYLLPGMATLVAMFSAIFSAMSLIEDRHEGVLQGALVSAAPRATVVGAKVLGAGLVAAAQGGLVLLAAVALNADVRAFGLLAGVVAAGLAAVGIAGLGLAAAWRIDSSAGFHGVMNLVLMPMWLLSGAFFPADDTAGWMGRLMGLNPLRWSTDAIRGSLHGEIDPGAWVGSAAFAFAMTGVAWRVMVVRPRRGGA